MATHSTILAWRIPWTEEPDWLPSRESQNVGHDSLTPMLIAALFTVAKIWKKSNPSTDQWIEMWYVYTQLNTTQP